MSYAARPLAERFWEKVDDSADCWVWKAAPHRGNHYGRMMTRKGHFESAHRLSYLLTFGEIPEGQQVLHKCDNRRCVNPAHLFLGTQLDNIRDMKSKGRAATGDRLRHPPQRGSLNHGSKLAEITVKEFKRRISLGESRAAVAKALRITRANAWAIAHGKSWAHI